MDKGQRVRCVNQKKGEKHKRLPMVEMEGKYYCHACFEKLARICHLVLPPAPRPAPEFEGPDFTRKELVRWRQGLSKDAKAKYVAKLQAGTLPDYLKAPVWQLYKDATWLKRVKHLRAHATHAERVLQGKLKALKIRNRFQRAFIGKHCYLIVDFYLPRYNLCIEVDGGYHTKPEQQAKDRRRDACLQKYKGLPTLRLTNDQVIRISQVDLLREIEQAASKKIKPAAAKDYKEIKSHMAALADECSAARSITVK